MATVADAGAGAGNPSAPLPLTSETAPVVPNSTDPVSAPTTMEPAEPTTALTTPTTTPQWPETGPDHPLTKLFDIVPNLVAEANHSEIYGITLSHANAFHTKLILQKFLRANQNDLAKAQSQLLETLKWRREFDPVAAAAAEYPVEKFAGLGAIVEVPGVEGSKRESDVVTFNMYGTVKDGKGTFGDLETFIRWRVGLMERGVQKLKLSEATEPIPDYGCGEDMYQGMQVHDYVGVHFFVQDKYTKSATRTIIPLLSAHYPETLSRKFFVNVPRLMRWMFDAMSFFANEQTRKKFRVLTWGAELADVLGPHVPKEYGGTAEALEAGGETLRLRAWGEGEVSPGQAWKAWKAGQAGRVERVGKTEETEETGETKETKTDVVVEEGVGEREVGVGGENKDG